MQAGEIVTAAVNIETGYRGYMLAGEKEFLEPLEAGKKTFFGEIKKLQQTVSDNPPQVARLKKAEGLIQDWLTEVIKPGMALRQRANRGLATLEKIDEYVSGKWGKDFFDSFRKEMAEFSKIEGRLIEKRQAAASAADNSMADALKTMDETKRWTVHTYKVIAQANNIIAAAVDMETGMRGYLLSGKESFLDPYKAGGQRFEKLVADLSKTVSDNPAQVKLLGEVKTTISDWKSKVTEPTIGLRRRIGDAKTMDDMADLVGKARGKQYFDKFRQLMADFSAEEEALMKQRQLANVATVENTYLVVGLCVAIALVFGIALAWLIGNGIANPISRLTAAMRALADGDTSVDIAGAGRRDEVGDMAEATQVFKDNAIEKARMEAERAKLEEQAQEDKRRAQQDMADELESSVKTIVQTIASASVEMRATAENMETLAQQAGKQSTAVAGATEEAASNVQAMAAASEELASSISEVAGQATESRNVTNDAQQTSHQAVEAIQELADMAQKIGDVVNLIQEIAEQTNLLALNATIEAARAGDAGKGFAVVASEVKELASQTAKATEEISSQISAMQSATENSVKAIEGIREVMGGLGESAISIAAAVEEQQASTQEISRSAQQAASGTQDVSSNISSVHSAVNETGAAASQVLGSASQLSEQSEALERQMDKFLNDIRAA